MTRQHIVFREGHCRDTGVGWRQDESEIFREMTMRALRRFAAEFLCLVYVGAASVALATPEPPAAPLPTKMGLHVTTPTGSGLLAGFSAMGPGDDIHSIERRMIELGCPNPLVSQAGYESKIFAPFSEGCDKYATIAFLEQIQKGNFPKIHSLDVQFFPLPSAPTGAGRKSP